MKRNLLHPQKGLALVMAVVLMMISLPGCDSSEAVSTDPEQLLSAMSSSLSEVNSVETSITLEMQGSFNNSDVIGDEGHNGTIGSDITIQTTFEPLAVHSQHYSRILVDGATTREDRDCYIVPSGDQYISYTSRSDSDEWTKNILSPADVLTIPRRTGFIYDWAAFMKDMTYEETQDDGDGTSTYVYTGLVNSNVLQELFGNNVFGTFMYSVKWLLNEQIPCRLYVDGETGLPDHFELDFKNEFTVSDMVFSVASVNVYYSRWNSVGEITVPKKASVVASDPDEEFYSTYYAWNLFLPYVGGQITTPGVSDDPNLSFTADWNTFQVRIDGGMTAIPFPYEDLKKIGYTIEDKFSSYIMEPGKYKDNIAVMKGRDKLICTFYNDDTVPQPITACKIGCIDISAADQPENGIKIYLPGEVTLGITKDALISAYGEPVESVSAFSCDTLTWKGESELQSFMAEISPITNLVIRLQVKNITVTGGKQN